MKRGRAEAGLPSSKAAAESPAKAQRRQKGSTPKASAAAGRTRQAVKPDRARKGRGDDKGPAAAAAADLQQSSTAPVAPAEEEVVGWVDGVAELGDWWWGLWGVEEDKLSGWFPFVDEDFLCSDARGGELSGGLLWEEAYHDIWQLQHIYEIPQAASN